MTPPPSQVATDLRACLTAFGPGDDVLGGVALFGVTIAGLGPTIDAVLLLRRGVLVVVGVDLPDPALRLDAPLDGPWLVDGWQFMRPDGGTSPVGDALAATDAVVSRLRVPGTGAAPLPVHAVVAVGPYAGTIVQPPGDAERGPRVLVPSARTVLGLATETGRGVPVCAATAAAGLLWMLAPETVLPSAHAALLAEGFAP
jgi:hypothetical protein